MPNSTWSRRRFIAQAAGAAATLPAASAQTRNAAGRPNILFLLSDDQRWDALGCMGNKIVRTPHLDKLAAGGVLFRNNFCATSICAVSRATIFSGLHEKSHGVSGFQTSLKPEVFAQTYPELLRKNGYRTGFLGKYGVGRDLPKDSFDYWGGAAGQGGPYFQEWKGKKLHHSRLMEAMALDFLNGCSKEQPFCLSVSFRAGHAEDRDPKQYLYDPAYADLYKDVTIPVAETADPRYFESLPDFLKKSEGRNRWGWRFTTPESYQEMVKGYYRLLTGMDDAIGNIVRALGEHGMRENTVIVFTADNGYFLAEHGMADKWLMYEESIRTPLIVHDPRLPAAARGKERQEMVLNVDIAPTLVSLAGVDVPRSMQGRNLMPLVRGEHPRWRKEWFYSHLPPIAKIPQSEGIREERWKYFRWVQTDPVMEEMYDLRSDPREKRNLAGDPKHAAELRRLQARWKAWNDAFAGWRVDREWRDPAV